MKLWQLLKSHLGPYRKVLLTVVGLQSIATFAALTLPTINANLIDNGVLQGDNAYIMQMGAVMLFFSLVQIVFATGAVWFGARAALGFGRDIRRDLFHTVTGYSAEEVGHFGAPSLITRTTNDVTQIQTLVVLATTMMIAAPLTMVIGIFFAVREDLGLSVILLVAIPAAVIILGSIVYRMVPSFQAMQGRVDRVNLVLREQITGMRVVRAFVREPQEAARFSQANDELTQTALRAGRLQAATFPTVMLIINMSSIAVDLARRQRGCSWADRGRHLGRLPQLPHPDPLRRGHGHVHGVHDPTSRGRRRSGRRSARDTLHGPSAGAPRHRRERAGHAGVP